MTEPLSDSRFVELLTSSQVRLRCYALSLIRISADADDVVQNASIALWEKRKEYDPNRDFFPWACGVVLVEVLRYRRKVATDKLMFDEVLLNTLATEYIKHVDELDHRRELLHDCVLKLPEKDKVLLNERYGDSIKPKEIAKKHGCPPTTVYSALARIRESLHRCIDVSMAQDSHPST
jgi:RNA polymerase sigma-70 factor (ECF subfamily)